MKITRHFAYKMNIPGAYESRDFGCTVEMECSDENAQEIADLTNSLHGMCMEAVFHNVIDYKAEHAKIEAGIALAAEFKKGEAAKKQQVADESAKLDALHAEKMNLSGYGKGKGK